MKVGEKTSWPKIWAATKEAGWALGAPFAILGGIYGGIFTPTEAAGVAAIYSIIVTMFIYRDIDWHELWRITLAARLPDRADPDHRDGRRHLFVAADHERHPAEHRQPT